MQITTQEYKQLKQALLYYTDPVNYVQHQEGVFMDTHEANIMADRGRNARVAIQVLSGAERTHKQLKAQFKAADQSILRSIGDKV